MAFYNNFYTSVTLILQEKQHNDCSATLQIPRCATTAYQNGAIIAAFDLT